MIPNIHPLNLTAINFKNNTTKHKLQIDSRTVIVGDFNIPLAPIDRSSKQKTIRNICKLHGIIGYTDLVNIYRTLHTDTT